MRDRTAQTEPLTIGQQIVAKWEAAESPWSEPADLAEAIDDAVKAEREACAKAAEPSLRDLYAPTYGTYDRGYHAGRVDAATVIRSRR